MSIPKENEKEFAEFPAVLRELVMAELAAGNSIAEFAHGFPAAPCGAYIKLALPVSSRPRGNTADLDFYDRNSSSYSGEFTDDKRHFFVLEPPHAPEPEPDMDAIRAKLEASYAASNAIPDPPANVPNTGRSAYSDATPAERAIWEKLIHDPNSVLARFKASMQIDYDKWHDGIGYDLELIPQATAEERNAIEGLLIQRRNEDWRDVEALAALGTDRAKEALKQAFNSGSSAVRMAVHSYAPELISQPQRTASLVQVLQQGDRSGGLTTALLQVESFHPPEIITTLLRGLMERDGGTACHYAAMLYFLNGKSASAFDWDHRPFFLRFNTEDMKEREKAVRELCTTIGVDPSRYIKPRPHGPV
ncbi:MAG: hypothetical protein ABI599_11365 [Flavobacteriales bacterium]